jgi:hypothetical protein
MRTILFNAIITLLGAIFANMTTVMDYVRDLSAIVALIVGILTIIALVKNLKNGDTK